MVSSVEVAFSLWLLVRGVNAIFIEGATETTVIRPQVPSTRRVAVLGFCVCGEPGSPNHCQDGMSRFMDPKWRLPIRQAPPTEKGAVDEVHDCRSLKVRVGLQYLRTSFLHDASQAE